MWAAAYSTSLLALVSVLFPFWAQAPIGQYPRQQLTAVALSAVIPDDESPRIVKVLFAGDMLFDRSIRKTVDEKGGDFIFSCIDDVLKSADFVVANLEGPITEHESVSAPSSPGDSNNYTFTFPPETARLLAAHNIRLVNIGNNHILNFGTEGARSTIDALNAAGVAYFGLPAIATAQAGDPILHSTYRHQSFFPVVMTFIGYNEFDPIGTQASAAGTVEWVNNAHENREIPIVYTHWGDEYATESPERIKKLAREFIDAGAKIVIGSHPHVVAEHEIYRGRHIYYSLGNFIFDQYFSDEVRNGLMLLVTFNQFGVQDIEEIPIWLETDRRTCPHTNFAVAS